MKKRSTEILRRLLDVPTHALSLQALLTDYHISEKTLRSDVQSILSFIRLQSGESVVAFSGGGVVAL